MQKYGPDIIIRFQKWYSKVTEHCVRHVETLKVSIVVDSSSICFIRKILNSNLVTLLVELESPIRPLLRIQAKMNEFKPSVPCCAV